LSEMGYHLLLSGLNKFKRDTRVLLGHSRLLIKKFKRFNLTKLSSGALADKFSLLAEHILSLWQHYFWTEYYCYDKVNLRIKNGGEKEKRRLTKAVREMQKQKFLFRTQINKTLYPPGLTDQFSREIARRLGLRDLSEYHYAEVLKLLHGQKIPRPQRQNWVMGKFNGWRTLTGFEASRIVKIFDDFLLRSHSHRLTGQVGNRGFYRGRVKVIPFDIKADYLDHIAKMKKGQVLVTGSTGPELILACRKAGAIVTEEGGITSHAAIVSRELGIPCVIGTKVATKVFKDGDTVEVDALNGVVKKYD